MLGVVISIVSVALSYLANKKSDLALSAQNFESHFETIIETSISLWGRVEKLSDKNFFLDNETSKSNISYWSCEMRYLHFFKKEFFKKEKKYSYEIKEIFLKEFITLFYQWGSTILHLYGMIDSSQLKKNEKEQRKRTINRLMSIHQIRLLYIWCVLSKKTNDIGFKAADSLEDDNGNKEVFLNTREWLTKNGWYHELIHINDNYNLKNY